MSDTRNDSNEPNYPHFQIYYDTWLNSFAKPSDPLVLFYHWLLIHNRFKCVIDGQKSDHLPNKWNLSKEYYDFFYTKHSVNYRLEIYLIGNLLHINFKRLSDSLDTLQHVKILDYVNETDYKNSNFKSSFKSLHVFYKRIQWSIDMVKEKRSKEICSSSSSIASASSFESVKHLNQLQHMSKSSSIASNVSSLASSSYTEIITQIKQEKIDMDKELEILRQQKSIRHSISSASSTTSKEADKIKLKKSLTSEQARPKSKATVLYEYNPIQKYYNYNYNVDRAMSIDENNTKNDDFIRASFDKYNLKFCNINLTDCMKTNMFKDLKIPIKLTTEMKDLLNIKKKSCKDKGRSSTSKKRKKRKRCNPIWTNPKKGSRSRNQTLPSFVKQEAKDVDISTESVPSSYCTANTEPIMINSAEKPECSNDDDSNSLPEMDLTLKNSQENVLINLSDEPLCKCGECKDCKMFNTNKSEEEDDEIEEVFEFPTKNGKAIDLTKAFENLNDEPEEVDLNKVSTVETQTDANSSDDDDYDDDTPFRLLDPPAAKRNKVYMSPTRTYFTRNSPMKEKLERLNEKLTKNVEENVESPSKRISKRLNESLINIITMQSPENNEDSPKSSEETEIDEKESNIDDERKTPVSTPKTLNKTPKDSRKQTPQSQGRPKKCKNKTPTNGQTILQVLNKNKNDSPTTKENQSPSDDEISHNSGIKPLYNLKDYEPFPEDLTAEKIATRALNFLKEHKTLSQTFIGRKVVNVNPQVFNNMLLRPKNWSKPDLKKKYFCRYMLLNTWLDDTERLKKIL